MLCGCVVDRCYYGAVMSVLVASELPGVLLLTSMLIELKAAVRRSEGNGQGAARCLRRDSNLTHTRSLSQLSLNLQECSGKDFHQMLETDYGFSHKSISEAQH